jgi:serine/threonine protein kinase
MSGNSEKTIEMRTFATGERVAGRYHLIDYLAEGNFGAVYRASHYAFGLELRQVAIKISKRPLTDSQARRVFNDALVMAKVQESAPPHLRERFVTVHDAGTVSDGRLAGHPFVVMELVEGGSLKDSLCSGGFPLQRTIATFDQILEAMACVHQERFVHRDLKPSNILVSRQTHRPDLIKLTDFGLAQQADSLLGWIECGGDLAHLAPECFTHDICSPQTDVYMLGLIFYEMLTGKNPFSDVGRHLNGKDDAKAKELKDLHIRARDAEEFEFLERDEEIKRNSSLGEVIRKALAPSMSARPYSNPAELKVAWDKAKLSKIAAPPVHEYAWDKVRRLIRQAEILGIPGEGDKLLDEAMKLNRNKQLVPADKVVGKAYLLQIGLLLDQGKLEEAGKLASEGIARRRCEFTLLGSAKYFRKAGNKNLAEKLESDANACRDKDHDDALPG